jgi:hypothetical protein
MELRKSAKNSNQNELCTNAHTMAARRVQESEARLVRFPSQGSTPSEGQVCVGGLDPRSRRLPCAPDRPVTELLDLLGRDPRLRKHPSPAPRQPARVEPVGLRAPASTEKRPRLHRLGQPDVVGARDELAPHPPPTGRRLDRHRLEATLSFLCPATETLPVRREAPLDHLASGPIEHRRLEGVLLDVDRCVHRSDPLLIDRGPIVLSRQDRACDIHAMGRDPSDRSLSSLARRPPAWVAWACGLLCASTMRRG